MTKTIAITGGTGQQGGGVANILLKTPGWKVRIITRNVESDKAKALASQGAEVVSANLDDEASLVKAFEVRHTTPHPLQEPSLTVNRALMPSSV